jgi:hypothetical protein
MVGDAYGNAAATTTTTTMLTTITLVAILAIARGAVLVLHITLVSATVAAHMVVQILPMFFMQELELLIVMYLNGEQIDLWFGIIIQ